MVKGVGKISNEKEPFFSLLSPIEQIIQTFPPHLTPTIRRMMRRDWKSDLITASRQLTLEI